MTRWKRVAALGLVGVTATWGCTEGQDVPPSNAPLYDANDEIEQASGTGSFMEGADYYQVQPYQSTAGAEGVDGPVYEGYVAPEGSNVSVEAEPSSGQLDEGTGIGGSGGYGANNESDTHAMPSSGTTGGASQNLGGSGSAGAPGTSGAGGAGTEAPGIGGSPSSGMGKGRPDAGR